jgi:hypothetical protein
LIKWGVLLARYTEPPRFDSKLLTAGPKLLEDAASIATGKDTLRI